MIIIQLAGGLGNQMFQYALYLQLKSLGKTVKIDDVSGFVQDAQREPALAPFGVSYERATAKELEHMLDSSMLPWNRVRRKLCGRKKKSYFEADKRYKPEIMEWDDIYLEGYWQTEKYFGAVSEEVRAAYDTDRLLQAIRQDTGQHAEQAIRQDTGQYAEQPIRQCTEPHAEQFTRQYTEQHAGQTIEQCTTQRIEQYTGQRSLEDWLARITTTDSVSVHIRRGDYLFPENQQLFGGICTETYYRDAMAQMKRVRPDCRFYLFTNDKEWAAERIAVGFDTGEDIEIIDLSWHSDYAEFVLMSKCRHHILANSSFSWWASYLNKNPDKTVLAPKRWLNGWDCEDFYREDMRRI